MRPPEAHFFQPKFSARFSTRTLRSLRISIWSACESLNTAQTNNELELALTVVSPVGAATTALTNKITEIMLAKVLISNDLLDHSCIQCFIAISSPFSSTNYLDSKATLAPSPRVCASHSWFSFDCRQLLRLSMGQHCRRRSGCVRWMWTSYQNLD